MKKLTLSALALSLLMAAAVGYWAGHEQASEGASQKPERQVLYWYDPMVPGQRFAKPGKSPFMEMDLVPRYADEETQQGGVTVDARQQQNLGMRTAPVERRALASPFSAFATVEQDERSVEVVPATATGVVETLFVRATGQQVKAGEPLARLWIPQWTAAQQAYLAVRQLGDPALSNAARERLALQFMPQEVIALVERSGKPQPRVTLRASRNGYVTKLETREGAQVAATAPLFELAGLDSVWLVVDYPASQTLEPESEVVARSESWPGERFTGRVSELLPTLESGTRTRKARVVLDNPQQKLRPGMYLTVQRAKETAVASRLAIPEEALIETGSGSRVLVAQAGGRFTPVNVTTGMRSDGFVEVLAGLTEGERVVTSGQFLIDSEASLRSALPQEAAVSASYAGEGVVKALEADSITLAHGPIPALNWGAMTMDFALARPVTGIRVGDKVSFHFTVDEKAGAVITHLMPAGEAKP